VHPYSQPRAPSLYYTDGRDNRWNFRRIEDIRNKFKSHGTDKPFWITEIGWPTCPSSTKCVNEAAQAADTQMMLDMIKSNYSSWVQAVFFYNFHDPSTQNPTNMENYFGLLRGDGSQKPVWNVIKAESGA
jgi:exo-beta-1,3-glucanase (GH17 family)